MMNEKILAKNRKAFHDYEILDRYECGISLLGSEVKSILTSKISLNEGYAQCINGEMFLFVHISPYEQKSSFSEIDPTRRRKLLLKKKEIIYLAKEVDQKRLTLIPLEVYKKRKIKIVIALCRRKKKYDKRDAITKNDSKKQLRSLKYT